MGSWKGPQESLTIFKCFVSQARLAILGSLCSLFFRVSEIFGFCSKNKGALASNCFITQLKIFIIMFIKTLKCLQEPVITAGLGEQGFINCPLINYSPGFWTSKECISLPCKAQLVSSNI